MSTHGNRPSYLFSSFSKISEDNIRSSYSRNPTLQTTLRKQNWSQNKAFNLESSHSTTLNHLLTTTQTNNIQRNNSYLRSRTSHRSKNNSNNQIDTASNYSLTASNYSLTDSKYSLTASNYSLTANSTDELMNRLNFNNTDLISSEPGTTPFPPLNLRGVPQPQVHLADGLIIAFMFSLWGYSIYLTYRAWHKTMADSGDWNDGKGMWKFIMEVVRNKKKPASLRSSRTDQDIEILAKEEGELIHLQVEEEEEKKEEEKTVQFNEEKHTNDKMFRIEHETKHNHLQNKTILNPDENLPELQPYQPTDQWTRRENFHQRLQRHETSILVQHRHQKIQVCRSTEDYEYRSKRQEEDEKLIQRIEEEERLHRIRENEENIFRRREDEAMIHELMDEINQSNENEDGSLVTHGNELELLIRLRSEEDMKMLLHQERIEELDILQQFRRREALESSYTWLNREDVRYKRSISEFRRDCDEWRVGMDEEAYIELQNLDILDDSGYQII